ncbi:MAG: hypothetical protein ACRD3N_10905 [Terracidiphilus sp.]
MAALSLSFLALARTGGTTPAKGGFGYGAGLILVILVTLVVGLVLIALIRAGRRR